jgi:hypothetical protein
MTLRSILRYLLDETPRDDPGDTSEVIEPPPRPRPPQYFGDGIAALIARDRP